MLISNRRKRIKEIIENEVVCKQEELANILNNEGYSVTQATVSRDIKELGLIKVKDKATGKPKYAVLKTKSHHEVTDEKVITLLKTFIISVESAKNLIVVKTLTGNGSACGMAIDKLMPEGVIGSIAGDDTLLIVTHDDETAISVVDYIKEIVELWFYL